MALNQQPGSRAKLLQILSLMIALIALNGINISSALKTRKENSPENGDFKRHIRNCDKQFKTFATATVRLRRGRANSFASTTAGSDDGNLLMVDVRAFGNLFQLELKPNKYLIHPNYMEKSITVTGQVDYFNDANSTDVSCYFLGTVRNQADSTVAAVTCDGFRAQIAAHGELYHVESVDGTLEGEHRVYRESDSLLPKTSCGDDSSGGHDFARVMDYLDEMGQHRKKRAGATANGPNDLQGVSRIVELYVANDYSQFVNQGSNVSKTIARTKEIINFVSSLYQPLKIYVSLVGVEVWNTGNLISVMPTDTNATLFLFSQYRANNISQHHMNDNAQLLTNIRYANGSVGYAWSRMMCSSEWSSALVSDISAVSGFTASISAHEMGHNLGMQHDNDFAPVNCACDDPIGLCLMQSSVQVPAASRWSNCSTSTLSSFLSSSDSSCLNDFNGVLYDPTPFCGNGIVESGEQCDCGNAPLTDCNPSCCNKTTCKLIGSAVCASGRCCNISTCQVCNNLNHSHCDVGYGPPDCSQPGDGGSYHSYQITQPMTSASLVVTTTPKRLVTAPAAENTTQTTTAKSTAPPVVTTTPKRLVTAPAAENTTQTTTAKSTAPPVVTTTPKRLVTAPAAENTTQTTTAKSTAPPVVTTTPKRLVTAPAAEDTTQTTTAKSTAPLVVSTRASTAILPVPTSTKSSGETFATASRRPNLVPCRWIRHKAMRERCVQREIEQIVQL